MGSFRACCVTGCKIREGQGITLHRFPNPTTAPDKFKQWVDSCGENLKGKDDEYIFYNRRICRRHFTQRDHYPKNKLCSLAIPILNIPEQQQQVVAGPNYKNILECHKSKQSFSLEATSKQVLDTSIINLTNDNIDTTASDNDEPTENTLDIHDDIPSVPDDKDIICPTVGKVVLEGDSVDVSLYCENEPVTKANSGDKHAEYRCNECQKEVAGFRYACVQCADWDLCGACEARAAHAAHYVLRVPSPRPYNEIQAVLAAIRKQLLEESLFSRDEIFDDSIKSEPEEEEVIPPEPADEPDPLSPASALSNTDSVYTVEALDDFFISEESDADPSSPKRPRLLSSGSDDSLAEKLDFTTSLDHGNSLKTTVSGDSERLLACHNQATKARLVSGTSTSFLTSNDASERLVTHKPVKILPSRLIASDNPTTNKVSDKPIQSATNNPFLILCPGNPPKILSNKSVEVFYPNNTSRIIPDNCGNNNKVLRNISSMKAANKVSSQAEKEISLSNLSRTLPFDNPTEKNVSDKPARASVTNNPMRLTSGNPSRIRLPRGMNTTDIVRAMKVSVRLEPLRIGVIDNKRLK